MIKKLEITGVHIKADEKLKEHVIKIVNKLEHYIPRSARPSAHVDVKLIEKKSQGDKKHTAEVIMNLPHGVFTAKESTSNMFTAVSNVEKKLKIQLIKYKYSHTSARFRRHLTARFRKRSKDS